MTQKIYAIISGRTSKPIEYSPNPVALREKADLYNEHEDTQPDRATAPWRMLYVVTRAPRPYITNGAFDELCRHRLVRANREGNRVGAARLVLVEGESQVNAAKHYSIAPSNVSALVNKMVSVYYGFTPTK